MIGENPTKLPGTVAELNMVFYHLQVLGGSQCCFAPPNFLPCCTRAENEAIAIDLQCYVMHLFLAPLPS